jgi:hypothetical protein
VNACIATTTSNVSLDPRCGSQTHPNGLYRAVQTRGTLRRKKCQTRWSYTRGFILLHILTTRRVQKGDMLCLQLWQFHNDRHGCSQNRAGRRTTAVSQGEEAQEPQNLISFDPIIDALEYFFRWSLKPGSQFVQFSHSVRVASRVSQ